MCCVSRCFCFDWLWISIVSSVMLMMLNRLRYVNSGV